MQQTVQLEITEAEAASLRSLIAECLPKFIAAQEKMQQDQVEIEELQAETRAILDREWKAA